MAAAGRRSWFLWTLRDNPPARAFYEGLGGRLVAERATVVEGTTVEEVGYGWDSLADAFRPPEATPPGV